MSKPNTSTPASDALVLPLQLAHRHHEVVNFLALLGHGEFFDQLTDKRLELENAISETGKAGDITIKIKVAPNGQGKRVLTFEPVKIKKPVVPAGSTYVFASQSGQYLENDPEQRELPLKNVTSIDEGARQLRAVGE